MGILIEMDKRKIISNGTKRKQFTLSNISEFVKSLEGKNGDNKEIELVSSVRDWATGLVFKQMGVNENNIGDLDEEMMMCILHVGGIVDFLSKSPPHFLYAVDFWLRDENLFNGISKKSLRINSVWLRYGADWCFAICTFFTERKTWRVVSENYYPDMGKVFYSLFSDKFGESDQRSLIGRYMSKHFDEVSELAREAFASLEVK